jgi:hypothetical protein
MSRDGSHASSATTGDERGGMEEVAVAAGMERAACNKRPCGTLDDSAGRAPSSKARAQAPPAARMSLPPLVVVPGARPGPSPACRALLQPRATGYAAALLVAKGRPGMLAE